MSDTNRLGLVFPEPTLDQRARAAVRAAASALDYTVPDKEVARLAAALIPYVKMGDVK